MSSKIYPFGNISLLLPNGDKALENKTNTENSIHVGSMTFRKINPNESTVAKIPLYRLFDLTLDGEYKVSVTWKTGHDSRENNDAYVSSEQQLNINNEFDFEKIFVSSNLQWSPPRQGVSLSLATDKAGYDDYGPAYLRLATRNESKSELSMPVDTANVLDAYTLTLKTPGENRDFCKPKDKDDVQNASLTLYGQKLASEKSKTPKPPVTVKPGEVVAETVIVLNRIFDMSEDGIYGLTVSRKFVDADGKERTVTSDPLPIRVGTALTQDEIVQRVKEREERDKKN